MSRNVGDAYPHSLVEQSDYSRLKRVTALLYPQFAYVTDCKLSHKIFLCNLFIRIQSTHIQTDRVGRKRSPQKIDDVIVNFQLIATADGLGYPLTPPHLALTRDIAVVSHIVPRLCSY